MDRNSLHRFSRVTAVKMKLAQQWGKQSRCLIYFGSRRSLFTAQFLPDILGKTMILLLNTMQKCGLSLPIFRLKLNGKSPSSTRLQLYGEEHTLMAAPGVGVCFVESHARHFTLQTLPPQHLSASPSKQTRNENCCIVVSSCDS